MCTGRWLDLQFYLLLIPRRDYLMQNFQNIQRYIWYPQTQFHDICYYSRRFWFDFDFYMNSRTKRNNAYVIEEVFARSPSIKWRMWYFTILLQIDVQTWNYFWHHFAIKREAFHSFEKHTGFFRTRILPKVYEILGVKYSFQSSVGLFMCQPIRHNHCLKFKFSCFIKTLWITSLLKLCFHGVSKSVEKKLDTVIFGCLLACNALNFILQVTYTVVAKKQFRGCFRKIWTDHLCV